MKFPWSHGLRSQQGQDIIEYSLMLAIIVGVGGMLINHENVAGHISHIFTSAGELMDRISPRDADLPSIDTSGMTDAQKQDKGVLDAITRAMEEAIRKGDILSTMVPPPTCLSMITAILPAFSGNGAWWTGAVLSLIMTAPWSAATDRTGTTTVTAASGIRVYAGLMRALRDQPGQIPPPPMSM